jgi:hypothetical protein
MRVPILKAFPIAALAIIGATEPVAAQHDHVSEYAGHETSEVRSFTQQELDELRSAAGMGLARPAELNHYPGPKHALEMASTLGLDESQVRQIAGVQREMREAAIGLGETIIEAERSLNQKFLHEHVDDESLKAAVDRVAALNGKLRYAHLRAHLLTTALLTAEQVNLYDRQRGYAPREE